MTVDEVMGLWGVLESVSSKGKGVFFSLLRRRSYWSFLAVGLECLDDDSYRDHWERIRELFKFEVKASDVLTEDLRRVIEGAIANVKSSNLEKDIEHIRFCMAHS